MINVTVLLMAKNTHIQFVFNHWHNSGFAVNIFFFLIRFSQDMESVNIRYKGIPRIIRSRNYYYFFNFYSVREKFFDGVISCFRYIATWWLNVMGNPTSIREWTRVNDVITTRTVRLHLFPYTTLFSCPTTWPSLKWIYFTPPEENSSIWTYFHV